MGSELIGIDNMTADELNNELERGGKFVIFEYCISILIMTFKRSSNIYFIKGGESTFSKSIGCTFTSLIAGWWGFPWGPVHTIGALITNFKGGKNITNEVIASLDSQ